MIDMPNDFFLVQFMEEEDYRHALYDCPWMIADHYILVQRWRPFFTLTANKTKKVAAWIRIPGLPIELYNDRFLWRVGSKLGTMLKIDKLTSIHSRGKFARICVEVNLNRRLVSMINVLGHIIKLEYEGLHSVCFNCGKYGHRQDQCDVAAGPMKSTNNEAPKKDSGNMEVDTGERHATSNESLPRVTHKPVTEQENLAVTTQSEQDSDNLYGPWMLVKRRKNSVDANYHATSDVVGESIVQSPKETTKPRQHEEASCFPNEPNVPSAMQTTHISQPSQNPLPIRTETRVRNPLAGKNKQSSRGGARHNNDIPVNTEKGQFKERANPPLKSIPTRVYIPDDETQVYAEALRKHFDPITKCNPNDTISQPLLKTEHDERSGVIQPTNTNSSQ
ncbi:uncharacterized protein LOC109800297 [Cajanus cajan]|uniref:uncharacterized protein LOC109800297 n=1 Tax=Cajanus cajan TaxID=3821 RepID=UPI00098D9E0D|nr:uncharacterized protein LOC109800297 [Cajanus cajan]